MHELSIAQSILDAIQTEVTRHPGARLRRVAVRIGDLAGVNPDSLLFAFEALVRGTRNELLELEIEHCPRRHRCLDCGAEFEIKDYDFQCHVCAGMRSECISGDQLELAYLELEEL